MSEDQKKVLQANKEVFRGLYPEVSKILSHAEGVEELIKIIQKAIQSNEIFSDLTAAELEDEVNRGLKLKSWDNEGFT